jgi:integrase
MYFQHGRHWYVDLGVWHPLAKDLGEALQEYAAFVEAPRGGCVGLIDDRVRPDEEAHRGCEARAEHAEAVRAIAATRLKKILKDFAPEQVKPKHVATIKRAMQATPNMANRVLSFGRQVFDYALEDQRIESNPFVGVKRYPERKRTRLLLWEEWWKIRAAASRRLQLVMDGLYLTDRRVSEQLLNLDERDALKEGVYFPSTKTDKELVIRWNPDLRAWWAECLALRGGKVVRVAFEDPKRARPLFRTRHGRRPAYGTVRDEWDRACAKAGVEDAHLHDNRAFSATAMKKQAGGGEAGEVAAQRLLGHRERSTTHIYLRDREVEVVDGPTMVRSA